MRVISNCLRYSYLYDEIDSFKNKLNTLTLSRFIGPDGFKVCEVLMRETKTREVNNRKQTSLNKFNKTNLTK